MAAARDSITEVEFNKMMTTGLAPAKADDSAGTGHSGYLSKKRSACQTCRYGMGITSDFPLPKSCPKNALTERAKVIKYSRLW